MKWATILIAATLAGCASTRDAPGHTPGSATREALTLSGENGWLVIDVFVPSSEFRRGPSDSGFRIAIEGVDVSGPSVLGAFLQTGDGPFHFQGIWYRTPGFRIDAQTSASTSSARVVVVVFEPTPQKTPLTVLVNDAPPQPPAIVREWWGKDGHFSNYIELDGEVLTHNGVEVFDSREQTIAGVVQGTLTLATRHESPSPALSMFMASSDDAQRRIGRWTAQHESEEARYTYDVALLTLHDHVHARAACFCSRSAQELRYQTDSGGQSGYVNLTSLQVPLTLDGTGLDIRNQFRGIGGVETMP